MTKKIRTLTVLLVLGLLNTQGFGTPILDQHQESWHGGGAYFWAEQSFAQTFIPSVGDKLDHVEFLVDTWTDVPSVPATISIVETVAGEPSGAIVGSVTVPQLQLGWYMVDFSSESMMLAAGTQYGLVFSNNDPGQDDGTTDGLGIEWDGNPYPGGTLWRWTPITGWEVYNAFGPAGDADIAFRTWMAPAVPAPGALVLGSIGVALVGWLRRHR